MQAPKAGPPENSRAAAEAFRTRLEDLGRVLHRYGQAEWFGSPFHLFMLRGKKPDDVAAAPRNPRPADLKRGQAIAGGVFSLADNTLPVGAGGEPFDQPNPSRPFAEALHRMNWLGDLMATGEAGEREALRHVLSWARVFGGWNSFSWNAPLLERRVINLSCALRTLAAHASDLEKARLLDVVARQARHLLTIADGPAHAAEHACAAACAGTALAGQAGDRLMDASLARLNAALPHTVLADGGHATRSPEAGLSLLLDLLTLEDGLSKRGRPAPEEMSRALDRLGASLRVLGLPDGRLACFQGGEAGDPAHVAAAREASDLVSISQQISLPHAGYEKLTGAMLTVMVDAAAPAAGAWSEAACAQPAAIEVFCGRDRLITNCGWSPGGNGPEAMRLTSAGSTLSVGEGSCGVLARGKIGKQFGARLKGGPTRVTARRQENPQGAWLELAHDGWEAAWGVRHERLLYLDRGSDELRGEDRLVPPVPSASTRMAPVAVRFHLHPSVKASLARDRKSVLLQGPTTSGWWLRNDAQDVSIEHSVHYENGQPKRSTQVVLRSHIPCGEGGKIRWKLAAMTRGD